MCNTKKTMAVIVLVLVEAYIAHTQSATLFSEGRWQGRVTYKDADGVSRSELYELILAPDGTCIVTVSGKQDGANVFQDADGLWSFDENFFRLECDFPDPVFPHLPALNWVSIYQFDALQSRFTLLIKPYPGAKASVKAAFNKVDD